MLVRIAYTNMCTVAKRFKAKVIVTTFRGYEFKFHGCLMFWD